MMSISADIVKIFVIKWYHIWNISVIETLTTNFNTMMDTTNSDHKLNQFW